MKIYYTVRDGHRTARFGLIDEGHFISFKGSCTQRDFAIKCQEWWANGYTVTTWKEDLK